MLEAGRGRYRTWNNLYRSEYHWKLTRKKLLGLKYVITFTSGWDEKNRNGYNEILERLLGGVESTFPEANGTHLDGRVK